MNKYEHSIAHRILAAFLALVLVFGMIPITAVPTNAATTGVTIKVTDADGNSIEEVTVVYTIRSKSDAEDSVTGTNSTNSDGVVEVLESDQFVADDLTIEATVTKDGYAANELTKSDITSADQEFVVRLQATQTDTEPSEPDPTDATEPDSTEPTETDPVIKDIKLTAKTNLVYNGNPQELVELTGVKNGDKITWTVNGVASEAITYDETNEKPLSVPNGTNAGDYKVSVKVERDGCDPWTGDVSMEIAKADQSLKFNKYNDKGSAKVTISGKKELDFSATILLAFEGNKIGYNLNSTVGGIATIDVDGKLTIYDQGDVVVEAILPGNDNYNEAKVTYTLEISINSEDKLISFEYNNVAYTFGTNNGVVSEQTASKKYYNDANPTYEIVGEKHGLKINNKTGKVEIDNYSDLAKSLSDHDGTVHVTIKAHKQKQGWGRNEYRDDDAYYTITIKFAENGPSASDLTIEGTLGNNDWYTSDVTISAPDGYTIAINPNSFGKSVTIKDAGNEARYVYLRNSDGGIYAPIAVELKIDKAAPNAGNMSISYEQDSWFVRFTNWLFNKQNQVKVTFTVKDESVSGIDHINWYYNDESVDDGAEAEGLTAGVLSVEKKDDVYSATLVLNEDAAEQLRGKLSFTATDKAGNTSARKSDNYTIVYDTIAPVLTAADVSSLERATKYTTDDGMTFYGGSVVYSFTIDEANFYPECLEILVDGKKYDGEITWGENGSEHTGSIWLIDDGVHDVSVAFADYSGNLMTGDGVTDGKYKFPTIIIDTVAPVVELNVAAAKNVEVSTTDKHSYYDGNVEAMIWITETNFYEDCVEVTVNDSKLAAENISWSEELVDGKHQGTFTLSGDGDYKIEVTCTDKNRNYDIDNSAASVDNITIDTTNPVITVKYGNNIGKDRTYYQDAQTATVTITEHNFDPNGVTFNCTDENGSDVDCKYVYNHEENTDIYTYDITFTTEANYNFSVKCDDLAKNHADSNEGLFTVDATAPSIGKTTYNGQPGLVERILETITFGFYKSKVQVTVTGSDAVSGIQSFGYRYVVADGVSAVNKGGEGTVAATYDADGTPSATFEIPANFNGYVTVWAVDRSGNKSDEVTQKSENGVERVVVDNIAPTAQISYNEAVNIENGVSYYDGQINATVTITEANFYSNDVSIKVSKNGAQTTVTPHWTDRSTDVHVGTFTINGDGDYVVEITYADKSGNTMAKYTSNQMTIDTEILAPEITINGNDGDGKAYKDDVVPSIHFEDTNLDSYEVTLVRTNFGSKNVDVTDRFVGNAVKVQENVGDGTFNTFEKIAENDGIYKLTVRMRDKAGHIAETSVTFTVNRFGSVYEYNDYLIGLIANGGAYVTRVTDDLVIYEYNADKLVSGSLVIEITCDGKPLDHVIYEATPEINDTVAVGDSGWYQYQYTISKDNFAMDGVYKISVSSKDATGNMPENSNYKDMGIVFYVDSTCAEITSVVGLENNIVNATEQVVKYTIFDTMGIKSIKIYVDGELVDEITEFSDDWSNYVGTFVLSEKSTAQDVRIVVEDLSGNITDTSAEDFTSAYEFNHSVTVSTNVFVRWYANKPLFWGSIAGVAVLVAALWIFLVAKNKKKEEVAVK